MTTQSDKYVGNTKYETEKDKSFKVSKVYLKKPQRIEALSVIIVLTLMIY